MRERAKQRLILITISLDEKITKNDEAYKNILNAIETLHNSGLIHDTDYICYNIGSPLLGNYLKSDMQKHMPDFASTFSLYQGLNEELREKSETFHILNKGKDINLNRVIKLQTQKVNTKKNTERKRRQLLQLIRAMVHTTWTVIATAMLYKISWENSCLVRIGYPKPYMVYKEGSPAYEDQLSAFGDDPEA